MAIALWNAPSSKQNNSSSPSAGRIKTWSVGNEPDNPTPQQLKVTRQKQVQAKPKKTDTSLFSKVKTAGKAIVDGAKDTASKSINTVGAGVSGTVGVATAGVQAAKGDKAGAKRTLTATQQDMNERLKKSYLTPEQAKKGGTSLIKPGAQAVADIAPYVIPVGKTAKGASLLTKVARGAVDNAAVSGSTTLANEAIQGRIRDKKTAGETAKSLLTGAVVGAAVPLLHGAVKTGAESVSTKGARETLQTAKQNSLLDTVRKPSPEAPTTGPYLGKGSSMSDVNAPVVDPPVIKPEPPSPAEAKAATKAGEKDAVQSQKINRQIELIQAKAKDSDTGLSEVDKTKLIHLREDKTRLTGEKTPSIKAFGKTIPMTEENGFKATQTKDGSTVYEKTAMRGNNNRGDRQAITHYYTADGKKITPEQHAAMIDGTLATPKIASETPTMPTAVSPDVAAPKSVIAPEVQAPKPVTNSLPDTTTQRGTSKVATSIQEKAVARGLKNDFGDAGGYDKITIADQATKAVKLVNNRTALDEVINGKVPLPDGLRATALIKAVEEHPTLSKDHELINRLSQAEHLTGESSRSAQELRLAAERNPHSPVEAIKTVRKAREAAVERKTGKSVAKATSEETKAIKEAKTTVPKPTKETFQSFVDSLRC